MKKAITALILAATLAFGCSHSGALVNLTAEDVQNAEAMKAAAENLLKTWPVYSGIMVGALGDRIKDLPQRAIVAMATLDVLASKQGWTDYELGLSLGLRIHIAAATVTEAIKMYAPDLIDLLPALI